ncbi:hypothetical protein GCM10010433_45010 [Streptomyces pulveraceus]
MRWWSSFFLNCGERRRAETGGDGRPSPFGRDADRSDARGDVLGPVFELPSAVRRPARTLAALSGSPRYIQYRGDPPPCDRTHRTPHGPASGRTTAV